MEGAPAICACPIALAAAASVAHVFAFLLFPSSVSPDECEQVQRHEDVDEVSQLVAEQLSEEDHGGRWTSVDAETKREEVEETKRASNESDRGEED